LAEPNKPDFQQTSKPVRWRPAMNDLRARHMIHSAIKYYQFFGATSEIRDELLTVARRAIGTNPQTLSAAANQIEIMIANLKRER
jgi:alpha-glucuronidase